MIGKKLIITEEERIEIKTLYGLIREQDVTQKNPELTLDLSGTFGSGKYKLPEKANRVDDVINKIREFKKQNAGSVIEISVNSGESQVPNYDREKYPITGNKAVDFTKQKSLPVGAIAKYRAAALKSYIEKIAPDLQDSKLVINEPIIGPTKWNPDGGDEAGDEKFTKEQFANFKIKVIGKKSNITELPSSGTPGCATGLKINVFVPSHQCNNAEFFIMMNNTVLYNVDGGYTANLNNSNTTVTMKNKQKLGPQLLNPAYGYISQRYGKQEEGNLGGGRSDQFVVTPEQSKTIIESGKGFINIWMIGTTKTIHRDLPRVIITKNDVQVYAGQPKVAAGLLLVLDACGNKVVKIGEETNSQQPNVDSWVNKLLLDRSKINIKKKLPEIMDGKQIQLEKSGNLVELVEKLEMYLRDTIFNGDNFNSDNKKYNRLKVDNTSIIAQTYSEVYPILQSNSWERKTPLKSSYSNKSVESALGGDIKLDLDKFYDIFNKIYYSEESKTYLIRGNAGNQIIRNLGISY